jgi:hypothetical protein
MTHPDDIHHHLDAMRLELITDLSHQLRTPVTAVKLALEGLFGQLDDEMDEPQQRLAEISRRNLDRLTFLVEHQLELLQMALGEVKVSRRLVDVRDVIQVAASDVPANELSTVGLKIQQPATPHFIFTDPDSLRTLLRCLLCGGAPGTRRILGLRIDEVRGECMLAAAVHYLDPEPAAAGGHGGAPARPARHEFEYRAYGTLVEALGGRLEMRKNEDIKELRLSLPIVPGYDRKRDFLNPMRQFGQTASAAGVDVHLVACEPRQPECNATSRDFAERCRPVLSDADMILRGPRAGTFVVALAGRSEQGVSSVVRYLGQCGVRATAADPTLPAENETETHADVERVMAAVEDA